MTRQTRDRTTELLTVDQLTVGYRTAGGFGGRQRTLAVRDVGLTIGRGEIVAVVGESGSGKSTTAHALIGLLPRTAAIDAGRAVLTAGGRAHDLLGLSERRRRSVRGRLIGFVPQDPMVALNPVKRIGDQVAEVLLVHKIATKREARHRAIDALAEAGLDQPTVRAGQYPHQLSGGMRQRALIAQAMIAGPELLIADEPTSALDVTVQRRILDRITELTLGSGTGVLLITHDLGVAAERADRIVVMKSGRVVEQGSADDILHRAEHPYTQALLAAAPSLSSVPLITERPVQPPTAPDPAQPLLAVEGLVKEYQLPGVHAPFRAVDDVGFTIGRAETYGLVGESGSGKSTTARLAARLIDPDSGSVILDGADVTRTDGEALRRLRRRFQVVYQNPYASLDPRLTIEAIIAEPLSAFRDADRHRPDPVARRRRVTELVDRVALPSSVLRRRPAELSGGMRQRVAIARALALQPELVILDEPVSALDVSVQAKILELLVSLQDDLGLSYLFISHDLAVIRQIAHRVGVMRAGRLIESGPTDAIFEQPDSDYTRDLLDAIPGRQPAMEGRS
ncbi:dipeptide ABC transporter ATP-binding protein [Microlunatus soli]|uniref:Peptide/nickel transport system ATP-binding protein n=1 Tax=Microlunatus soli TaxID=630515 RepID=A0A1H1PJS3_9ACTN|nr:ABC transporter ATP-binding protein [Microlunatus soli]SDS11353.1 peptide/nickel transport system ATP-binding protein [Microlunatus soli]